MSLDMQRGNQPNRVGQYVVYSPLRGFPHLFDKRLLTWDGREWCYPMSDQKYREYIVAYIGPIPAKPDEVDQKII